MLPLCLYGWVDLTLKRVYHCLPVIIYVNVNKRWRFCMEIMAVMMTRFQGEVAAVTSMLNNPLPKIFQKIIIYLNI